MSMTIDQAQALRDRMKDIKRGRHEARLISVASGKGGVGKSVFAVNLAIAMSRRGKRVLVVDADFGLANIDVMLGVNAAYNLSHVLKLEKSIGEIVMEGYDGVRFISGGSGIEELLNMDEYRLQTLMTSFLQLEALADIIIFDVGAGISDVILKTLTACHETIIITTPEPTAILDAYALVKMLDQQPDCPLMRLVVNRAYTPREAADTLSSFCQVVHKYMHRNIDQLGYILNDPVVSQAVKMQVPFLVSYPKSTATANVEAICGRYLNLPEDEGASGGMAKFISKLAFWKQRDANGSKRLPER